jgi:hypothetical protein
MIGYDEDVVPNYMGERLLAILWRRAAGSRGAGRWVWTVYRYHVSTPDGHGVEEGDEEGLGRYAANP